MNGSDIDPCPRCGNPTECDEVDVGVGVMHGPRGCPACFWVETPYGVTNVNNETALFDSAPRAEATPAAPPLPAQHCGNCRFHSALKRPRIVGSTGFGDQMEFGDDDETVYSCKAFLRDDPLCAHAGTQIGTTPISCEAWTAPAVRTEKQREMDALMARAEARLNAKAER